MTDRPWLASALTIVAAGGFMLVVVIGAGEQRVAFGVEAVLNEQEVLVKRLGKPLLRVRNVAGATVLGNGLGPAPRGPGKSRRFIARSMLGPPGSFVLQGRPSAFHLLR